MTNNRKPTQKQRTFVSEYIKCRNATEAAINAGYSERYAGQQAGQLMAKPLVKELIEKNIKIMSAASHITFDWKVRKLEEIIHLCLDNQPANTANAIKAIEVLNSMMGHNNSESKHVSINIDATLEKLQQARLAYKEY